MGYLPEISKDARVRQIYENLRRGKNIRFVFSHFNLH